MVDLKGAAVHSLLQARRHPFQAYEDRGEKLPKLWAKGGRHVFLFDHEDAWRSIKYVRENPVEAGLPKQHWNFVVDYF